MGVGNAVRQAFQAMVRIQGQTILIHHNFDTPDATSFEARGLKNQADNSRQVVFQFPEQLDIPVGAVLQVKGSRDYWKATDTEDTIADDTFVLFEVRVEKINIAGQPTRPSVKGGTVYNLQGTHARVNIHSQDSSVNISHHITEHLFADMRQVIQTQIQNDDERTQILSRLNELEAAQGTDTFIQRYQGFIASPANHMTVLAPFIPALAQMLGG